MPEGSSRLVRIGGAAGVIGPVIALTLVFYSVSISPWFSWQGNALSDLGVSSAAVYFNNGLIAEGCLNFVFAVGVFAAFDWTRFRIPVGLLVGISGVSLAFVGVFTEHSGSLHSEFALGFFILYPLSLLVIAAVCFRSGRLFAALSAIMGIAALVAIFLTPHKNGALAIPEILEALILSAWSVGVGVFMAARGRFPVGGATP